MRNKIGGFAIWRNLPNSSGKNVVDISSSSEHLQHFVAGLFGQTLRAIERLKKTTDSNDQILGGETFWGL